MVALLVLLTVISMITVDYFLQRRESQRALVLQAEKARLKKLFPVLQEGRAAQIPSGYFLDPSHQWLHLEDSGAIRVGIDAFAAEVLSQMNDAFLPETGDQVERGEESVFFRKGKHRTAFRAPIGGKIEAVNPMLLKDPQIVEKDPFGQGWLYRIRPDAADLKELSKRKIGQDAVNWLKVEIDRLKDFVINLKNPGLQTVGVTAYDGGTSLLEKAELFTEEEWKNLSKKFFG